MSVPSTQKGTRALRRAARLRSLGVAKLSELEGKTVKLAKEVQTVGGLVYAVGTVMRVSGHWRGTLSLEDPATGESTVSHVSIHSVAATDDKAD